MCVPLAVAVAIGATALSVAGQMKAAHEQADAINHSLAVRDKEIDQAASAEINDRLRAARRQEGRILVAAGQSGLSTGSGNIEGLLLDNAMQATLANEQSLANRESRKEAAAAQAQSMMPSSPTLLGAGLQIGLAGAQAGIAEAQRKQALSAMQGAH